MKKGKLKKPHLCATVIGILSEVQCYAVMLKHMKELCPSCRLKGKCWLKKHVLNCALIRGKDFIEMVELSEEGLKQ